jgi:hypothetical protein
LPGARQLIEEGEIARVRVPKEREVCGSRQVSKRWRWIR